jgi:hypothetical protein
MGVDAPSIKIGAESCWGVELDVTFISWLRLHNDTQNNIIQLDTRTKKLWEVLIAYFP